MPAGKTVFIDSTTFLYTLDDDEAQKGIVAQGWLTTLSASRAGVTNLQVLNEVASVITRKSTRFGDRDPFFEIDAFAQFGTTPLTTTTALSARQLFQQHRYAWWDCLLLASALELGCTHFLSEDLHDGHRITRETPRSLTIINPFAHSADDILTQH
jgi:predicted nucleic acid-binding protein